jgi:hypothetical protein
MMSLHALAERGYARPLTAGERTAAPVDDAFADGFALPSLTCAFWSRFSDC